MPFIITYRDYDQSIIKYLPINVKRLQLSNVVWTHFRGDKVYSMQYLSQVGLTPCILCNGCCTIDEAQDLLAPEVNWDRDRRRRLI